MRFLEQQNCWNQLAGWENLADAEIFEVLIQPSQFDGQLLVISDLSYRREFDAFAVDAEELRAFVSTFHATFGECLFNGDVLIAQPEQQKLWVFHHEAVIACFSASARYGTKP